MLPYAQRKISAKQRDNQILIESLHFGTMCVKRKRDTDGTFFLYDFYRLTLSKHKASRRGMLVDRQEKTSMVVKRKEVPLK